MKTYENVHGQPCVVDLTKLDTEDNRLAAMFAFLRERHNVFLRRQTKPEAPWTEDYALANYRFCNIYRELDTVTLWIARNFIKPHADHPDLWFYLVVARFFNKPTTLQYALDRNLIDPNKFNSNRFTSEIEHLHKMTGAVFNSAYIINGIPKKGNSYSSKIATLSHDVFESLLASRTDIRRAIKEGYRATLAELTRHHGLGAFMANQVAVDLSYTKHGLKHASDIDTTISPGPGTLKGIRFILGGLGEDKGRIPYEDQYRVMQKIREASYDTKYWPVGQGKTFFNGFTPLSMPNVSNAFCETSKYMGLTLGLRSRLKNTYDGGWSNQPALF
jgi:alpha-glutamyl/putrescinyl thymine pyrophosphorylase clade 1